MKRSIQEPLVSRRTFLAFGSATLASTAALAFSGADSAGLDAIAAPSESVGIDYCVATEQLSDLNRLKNLLSFHSGHAVSFRSPDDVDVAPFSPRMAPASGFLRGDPEFIGRGARVSVLGIVLPERSPLTKRLAAVSVDLCVQPRGVTEPMRVHAWSYEHYGVPNIASARACVVPVNPAMGLTLAVSTRIADNESRHALSLNPACEELVQLSTATQYGVPKLKRGLYALSIGIGQSKSRRDWRGARWQIPTSDHRETRWRLACPTERVDGRAAQLPYVIVVMDYATSDAREASALTRPDETFTKNA